MRRRATLAAGLAVCGLALAACDSQEPQARPLTPVRVQTVASQDSASGLRYTASIAPKKSVNVAFKVGGYIESILQEKGADGKPRDIQTGDPTTAGMVLAKVKEEEYRDKVKEAKAQLAQARAAMSKADSDFKRAKSLFSTQSMTAPEFDTYKKEYQTAHAAVAGAKAQLDQAELNLSYCKLKSPLAGVVLQRNIEVGALVTAGSVGFVVADVSAVKAVFGVPDVVLKHVKAGSPLSIATASLPDRRFAEKVTSVAAAADSATRVFEVEVTVPNPQGLLKPDMVASLQVPTGAKAAGPSIAVPIAAIVRAKTDPNGYAVYIADGGSSEPVVRLQTVQVGQIFGNSAAVTSGLKSGDRVVVFGATLLTDGEKVRVIP